MTATLQTTTTASKKPPEPLNLVLRVRSTLERNDDSVNQVWNIDAILCGDGSVGKIGKKLEVGTFYGSAKITGGHEVSAKITGGHENYHAIDPFPFEFHTRGNRNFSFSTRLIGSRKSEFPRQCVVPIAKETRQKQKSRTTVIVEAVLNFCRRYPGVAVVIGGPGSRESCKELELHHVKKEDCLFATSSELDCLPAAIVNGIGAFRGPRAAVIAKMNLSSCAKHFLKVGQAGVFVHKLGLKCTIRKPGRHIRQSIRNGRFDTTLIGWEEEIRESGLSGCVDQMRVITVW